MKHVTSRKARGEWEREGEGKTVSIQKEQKDKTMAGKLIFASARISNGIWQVGFYSGTVVCVVSLRICSGCSNTGKDFLFLFF